METMRELAVYPRLLTRVLPQVERELRGWTAAARRIPDADLRAQALASLEKKKFHCVGGSVLALMEPARLPQLVRAIVAIQTISDYLDNLCDRSQVAARLAPTGCASPEDCVSPPGRVQLQSITGGVTPTVPPSKVHPGPPAYHAYLRLHDSMLCAVDPTRPSTDYYAEYVATAHDATAIPDGGYLDALVEASRRTLRGLPEYGVAKPHARRLVMLYSELQAGKHLPVAVRDAVMERWFAARYGQDQSEGLRPGQLPSKWLGRGLRWWEFAAATGSTLAVFALICASADPAFRADAAERLVNAYFPAVCGLHILLDYYIDQAEDVAGGDLNFVSHYSSSGEAADALEAFVRWSLEAVSHIGRDACLHRAVVRGLLAMYLSDPKIERQRLQEQASRLAGSGGGLTRQLLASCSLIRKFLSF